MARKLNIYIHGAVRDNAISGGRRPEAHNAKASPLVSDVKPAREMTLAEIEAELATYKSNGFGAPAGRYQALITAKNEKERGV